MKNHFTIPGPAGLLECALDQPTDIKIGAVAIVCHPHPLHGGTMGNKVVTTLSSTLQDLGMPVIRFNFRGIGQSEGEYANTIGELQDLYAVMEWVQQAYPQQKLWLAGFSFGSYISAMAASQRDVAQLISVAPPVKNFDFKSLGPISCPWVVVQGEEDEVVPSEMVFEWVSSRKEHPVLIRLAGIGHFFHGHLMTLRDELLKVLSE